MLAAPLTAAAQPDGLAGSGWSPVEYPGVPPARFAVLPDGAMHIQAAAGGSFAWRRLGGRVQCLNWRWRVDPGLAGAEDRVVSLAIGFAGYPPAAGSWRRTQHVFAMHSAGTHVLPRSLLIYSWGGAGAQPHPFYAPWLTGLEHVLPRRHGPADGGRWCEEHVDLAADWRAAFGADPPMLHELSIGTDVGETGSRLDARIEQINLSPC